MWERAQHIAWWLVFVFLALLGALSFYYLPAVQSMEDMETARQAQSAWGRIQLAAPGVILTLILAPVATAITYRCGARLPRQSARRGALIVGLLIAAGSFGGAVLFVLDEEAYRLPLWLFLHLYGHRLAPAAEPVCPFG